MTTCQKTVMFAFAPKNAVADATVTNLTQTTLYIPEASPTFKSVFVTVGFRQNEATAYAINEHRVGIRLGSASYTTFTETDDIANSSSPLGGLIGPIDFTSHFSTNWSGTSMTCDCQVYFDTTTGTAAYDNVNVMLYVTYEYNDSPSTNATQIRTVAIPFDSKTNMLPTTSTAYCTIPRLTSGTGYVLPEASVTIRDWFLVIDGNEGNNAVTTDFVVTVDCDGADTQTYIHEAALSNSPSFRNIYKPSSVPDTTAEHTINAWVSTGAVTRWITLAIVLYVTYEYDVSNTSTILNSRFIPWHCEGHLIHAGSSTTERRILVPEPGTISMKHSAFWLASSASSNPSMWIKSGSQTAKQYTASPSSGALGPSFYLHRIDSGGSQGAALTLSRGFNTINTAHYTSSISTSSSMFSPSGFLILNYWSDIPTVSGVKSPGIASHSVFNLMLAWNADTSGTMTNQFYKNMAAAFAISESNYYIQSAGMLLLAWKNGSAPPTENTYTISINNGSSSEGPTGTAQMLSLFTGFTPISTGETAYMLFVSDFSPRMRRTPIDPAYRLNLIQSRSYYIHNRQIGSSTPTQSNCFGVIGVIDYSSIPYSISGAITGYTGDGSGITVSVYSKALKEKIASLTSTTGGNFSATWYDDTTGDLWAEARQDDSHVGRSADFTAVAP